MSKTQKYFSKITAFTFLKENFFKFLRKIRVPKMTSADGETSEFVKSEISRHLMIFTCTKLNKKWTKNFKKNFWDLDIFSKKTFLFSFSNILTNDLRKSKWLSIIFGISRKNKHKKSRKYNQKWMIRNYTDFFSYLKNCQFVFLIKNSKISDTSLYWLSKVPTPFFSNFRFLSHQNLMHF